MEEDEEDEDEDMEDDEDASINVHDVFRENNDDDNLRNPYLGGLMGIVVVQETFSLFATHLRKYEWNTAVPKMLFCQPRKGLRRALLL
jgi:hypothetical protein